MAIWWPRKVGLELFGYGFVKSSQLFNQLLDRFFCEFDHFEIPLLQFPFFKHINSILWKLRSFKARLFIYLLLSKQALQVAKINAAW